MYESDEDEPMFEPEPIVEPTFEPEPIVEPNFERGPEADYEPNLPSLNHSRIIEPQRKSVIVAKKQTERSYLANENIPRAVLRLLNQFVTINTEQPSKYGAQAMFVLKNQQNR